MSSSPTLNRLIQSLTCLPGVGKKSAQRMAMHLLERDKNGALSLADSLQQAMEKIKHCETCRNYSDQPQCEICKNAKRQQHTLCIVETPSDVIAIEASAAYQGLYFVLLGKLSPLDGIGPDQLGLDLLKKRLEQEQIDEVILATNPTVEGEITAQFIADIAKKYDIKTTRIAHGVPIGGELEYVDGGTLSRALSGRQNL